MKSGCKTVIKANLPEKICAVCQRPFRWRRKWATGCRIGTDYPLPIVDHKEAVRHARARFAELRCRDDYWQESARVLQRHGSRKTAESRNRPQRPKAENEHQSEIQFDAS